MSRAITRIAISLRMLGWKGMCNSIKQGHAGVCGLVSFITWVG